MALWPGQVSSLLGLSYCICKMERRQETEHLNAWGRFCFYIYASKMYVGSPQSLDRREADRRGGVWCLHPLQLMQLSGSGWGGSMWAGWCVHRAGAAAGSELGPLDKGLLLSLYKDASDARPPTSPLRAIQVVMKPLKPLS